MPSSMDRDRQTQRYSLLKVLSNGALRGRDESRMEREGTEEEAAGAGH